MTKKTVRDIDVKGKTVLVRVDYNVPIEDGQVGDTLRLEGSFATIRYLLERDCKVVLISHLGRPEGRPNPKYSLKPVAAKAAQLLGRPVEFAGDCVGPEAQAEVERLEPGGLLLLENLRFHPEEEANDAGFARQLAGLAEVYVDDAFAAIHRAHASTVGVAQHLPAVAGLLVEREVDTIAGALERPERPLAAVIGGAKVSTKIEVLDNLIAKVDSLLIGGAMANTFLVAKGYQVGKSLYEHDHLEYVQQALASADKAGTSLLLPLDVVVTDKVDRSARGHSVNVIGVRPDDIIADVGPRTIERALKPLRLSGTVIWNGPLGISELPQFAAGSLALARGLASSRAKTIVGGGDTAAFIDAAGLHDRFDFVSTGGGASLELMAGKVLPGLAALLDRS
ncbi:phosphoglycerate kinase [Candidatus Parcubacteria bacterium]|nr:phosphoglycerate kinase [Candidatus Parcubacteria bacterium]